MPETPETPTHQLFPWSGEVGAGGGAGAEPANSGAARCALHNHGV